jgi:hypothetical protein
MPRTIFGWLILTACLSLFPPQVQGQVIPYIEVERTPSGTSGAAVQVFHDRYLPTTPLQTSPQGEISFPTSVSGNQRRLTDTNSVSSYDGLFTRYANGTAYAVPGYDASLGTVTVASTLPSMVNRIVGTVSASFTTDTSTGFNAGGSNSFRSVASVNGSAFWGAVGANGDGIVYISPAGSIQSFTTITSNAGRQVRIFNNSLFYSNGSSGNVGVFLVGSAGTLPTSSGTSTTLLTGTSTSGTGTPGSTGFYLFDNPLNANTWNGTGLNTLYIADDRDTASGGGVQRWVYNGSTWVLSGTMNSSSGLRGLTATIDTSGPSPVVSLWSTTVTATDNNALIYLQDTLSASSGTFGSVTTLANAGTGNYFRSVELGIVVPEPSSLLLLLATAAVGIYWMLFRRKKPVANPLKTKDDPTSTIFLHSL